MSRNLGLFYLFRLLSTSYLFEPVMVVYAASRGLDLFEIFLLSSIYSLTIIVSEVPTGALADRIGRRQAMMTGALLMVACCLTYYWADGFTGFAIAKVLGGLSLTLCSGADSAYLFDLLQEHGLGHDYARREGTSSAWHQGGQAVAFAAGGLLATQDLALPFLVSAGVASLAFVVALGMRQDRPQSAGSLPTAGEIVSDMREAVRTVVRHRRLQWVIGYSAVVFVLLRVTLYIYQPYLLTAGFDVLGTGLVFAGVYLVAAFVAHHTSWLRRQFSDGVLLAGLLGGLIATFLLLGALPGGHWAILVLAVQAAANGLYSPLTKPLLNGHIADSNRRATVLSVESMVRRGGLVVFPPVVGLVMDTWGTGAGLTACGLFGIVGAALLAKGWESKGKVVQVASVDAAPPGVQTAPLSLNHERK